MEYSINTRVYKQTNNESPATGKASSKLSVVATKKDTFSANFRKTDEVSEKTVKPQTAEKPSFLPTIVASVLGLSGLVVGTYALIKNNKSKALLEKSGADEKRIKFLEEQVQEAVATTEENIQLKLLLERQVTASASVTKATTDILEQNPTIIITDENPAKIVRTPEEARKTAELLQGLRETAARLGKVMKEQNIPDELPPAFKELLEKDPSIH